MRHHRHDGDGHPIPRGADRSGAGAGARLAPRLWTLGVVLVVLGAAARLLGWDALLWIPGTVLEQFLWIPFTVVEAVREDPGTYGVVALGVALMVLARLLARRG